MSIQTDVDIQPETISPEAVAASQQRCLRTSAERQTNVRVITGALGIADRLRGGPPALPFSTLSGPPPRFWDSQIH